MRAKNEEILQAQRAADSVFKRAYRFLRTAQIAYEDWDSIYMEAMDFGKPNMIAAKIIEENFGCMPVSPKPGFQRRLLASAITPDGMVNSLDTIVARCEKRCVIAANPGTGKSFLLQKVAKAALERGFFVEAYIIVTCTRRTCYGDFAGCRKLSSGLRSVPVWCQIPFGNGPPKVLSEQVKLAVFHLRSIDPLECPLL